MTGSSVSRRRSGLPELMEWLGAGFPELPVEWGRGDAHVIPIEVMEGDGRYVLRAQLPGVDPEKDISITVEGDTLTVRAEHAESTESTERKRHSEFRYGSFERTVRLPFPIPDEEPEAEYRDGILTVTVRRPAEPKSSTRSVPVRRAG
ncbi:Hsp20/alpha crystallin family protein [Streptomyces sp. UNOC14_S4]|uniref:Hsp20/alpha crystallin family protein n=1 Tax=Streptomyces sp. UNOC14_S4 TaxID=2872340 RepID=UPI001E338F88|nr:Hsp20/alpha crystallin family protein [Streptomyces sp. UNOC14_S4]MCC3771102.1 Hsp20/alpha crystallin family protein [Streptomyces sp. UNOC14_S4]